MGEYISVREMSQEVVLALPNPVRGYRHESFGIREYRRSVKPHPIVNPIEVIEWRILDSV